MNTLVQLVRGFPGKPSHPPLTDVSIGSYTAGVVMLVAGALGLEEAQMAHGALLAISLGLLVTVPTVATGLLDWLSLDRGAPARAIGTVHLVVMLAATVLFAATWIAQLDGYREDEVRLLAVIGGLAAEALLVVGGYLGGTLAYVYGIRVLKRPKTAPVDAVLPGRAGPESEPADAPAPGGQGSAGGG